MIVGLVGCSSHTDRLRGARELYYRGELSAAEAVLAESQEKKPGEADVLLLDRAMVSLAQGNAQQAERQLREVRDHFDHFEQKSLAEGAVSFLTDDTTRAYPGEDYEKILIRVFLSLSNLMAGGGDAIAYAHQIDDKQQQIVQNGADSSGENPKLAYRRLAIGPFIHAMLREESHASYDDVARSHQLVVNWEPDYRDGQTHLQRALHGRHSQPGNGVAYVLVMVGRGPYKVEAIEPISSTALLIADRILSATGEHTLPPNIAPIKVPAVITTTTPIAEVMVAIDGQPQGTTATLTNIGDLCVAHYQATYHSVLARAVVRRVVKKAAVVASKEALGIERNSFANFAMDVGGIAWEATENADTRCWGLLPDEIQVLRLELPAGSHQLSLQARGRDGKTGPPRQLSIDVPNGRNTYVLANFPGMQAVGKVLVR
jgi:hypothetical protein